MRESLDTYLVNVQVLAGVCTQLAEVCAGYAVAAEQEDIPRIIELNEICGPLLAEGAAAAAPVMASCQALADDLGVAFHYEEIRSVLPDDEREAFEAGMATQIELATLMQDVARIAGSALLAAQAIATAKQNTN